MMMYEREDINEILLNNARAMLHLNEKKMAAKIRKRERIDVTECTHEEKYAIERTTNTALKNVAIGKTALNKAIKLLENKN